MKSQQQIYTEMCELQTDKQRWQYLLDNKLEQNLPNVMLDNDCTFVDFKDLEDEDTWETPSIMFDQYLGWSDGVFDLLSVIGIKHESV